MEEYIKADVSKPIDFVTGGQFITTESWKHMKRNHDDLFVAIININNVLYIEQNGIQYVINPGDVFFLLPNQIHVGYKESPIGTSYYWFHFYFAAPIEILDNSKMDQEVLSIRSAFYPPTSELVQLKMNIGKSDGDSTPPDSKPAYYRGGGLKPIEQNRDKKNSTILLPVLSTPKYVERIHILCKQMLDVSKANYYNHYYVNYLATSLLIELSEQTITNFNTSQQKSSTDKKIETILEWVRIHALTNISVNMIAETFNYNSDYLSRIFKQNTGMNLKEYIHILKISKAKELLTRTNESIKMIAYSVGIHDEKYFMRLFKKYEKVTPSEYRKAYYHVPMNTV